MLMKCCFVVLIQVFVLYVQVMINFCMAAKEYQKTHEVSTAMILVCIFHFIYVADCLFYEVSENASSIQQNSFKSLQSSQTHAQSHFDSSANLGFSFLKVPLGGICNLLIHELYIL